VAQVAAVAPTDQVQVAPAAVQVVRAPAVQAQVERAVVQAALVVALAVLEAVLAVLAAATNKKLSRMSRDSSLVAPGVLMHSEA
jgi:hypothetical protein